MGPLITFGQVFLFKGNPYVWLFSDVENDEYHVAKILNEDATNIVRNLTKKYEKKLHTDDINAPVLAYVILTSRDFEGLAAHLHNSDKHVEKWENFPITGSLNPTDINALKKQILEGTGLTNKLVNLGKKLLRDKN
ncbi:MAG: hypothetical protein WBL19_02760 [Minisyncoccia bacterium]